MLCRQHLQIVRAMVLAASGLLVSFAVEEAVHCMWNGHTCSTCVMYLLSVYV